MKINKIISFVLITFVLFFYKSLPVEAAASQLDGRFVAPATIDLTTKVKNTLPVINGGSGINAYNVGDTLYSGSTNTLSKLSGNITTTPKMLMQTGNGTISTAPTWTQPTLNNILAPTSVFDFGTQNITGVNSIKTLSTNVAGIGGVLKSSSTIPTTLISTGLSSPQGVCADSAGNLYIADTGNNAIKKRDTSGVVTTLISSLSSPKSIIIDSAGNLYFTELTTLKKRDTSGVVTTLISGLSNPPLGIVMDNIGNLYVGSFTVVKKYDTTAVITTFASGFSGIYGLGIDSSNNIYVLDYNNIQIKKYNSSGTLLNTLNGAVNNAYNGSVQSMTVDNSGFIYTNEVISSSGNWIKKFDINTSGGYFSNPSLGGTSGLAISPDGKTMYIADTTNFSIKSIDLQGTIKSGATFNDLAPPTSTLIFSNQNLSSIGTITAGYLSVGGNVTVGSALISNSSFFAKAVSLNLVNITNTYSVSGTDYSIIGDTTAASFTITLPNALSGGRVIVIEKKVAVNILTVAGAGTQTINGVNTKALTAQYSSLTLISDGSGNWVITSQI